MNIPRNLTLTSSGNTPGSLNLFFPNIWMLKAPILRGGWSLRLSSSETFPRTVRSPPHNNRGTSIPLPMVKCMVTFFLGGEILKAQVRRVTVLNRVGLCWPFPVTYSWRICLSISSVLCLFNYTDILYCPCSN